MYKVTRTLSRGANIYRKYVFGFDMPPMVDLTGKRFGKLTVLYREPGPATNGVRWHCRCDCGNDHVVSKGNLTNGHTTSCGCYLNSIREEGCHKTHGLYNHPLHSRWAGIKGRCNNTNHTVYKYYGGKGIKVCPEWNTFKPFYDWAMAHGWREELTLDRIDPNGDYSPDNCRWVSMKEQGNNRTNSKYITYNGEIKTYAQWAEATGLPYGLIRDRAYNGHYTPEEIFSTPIGKYSKVGKEMTKTTRQRQFSKGELDNEL